MRTNAQNEMMSQQGFKILVKPKNALSQLEIEEIVELCSAAFEEPYGQYLDTFPNPTHVLARQDGTLVSHALWITRWMQVKGKPLMKTAYVEGVATEKSQQGKGYASAVMSALAEQISDFEIGGLSPAETNLYHRLGWEYWLGPLYARVEGRWLLVPEETAMIYRAPNTPPLDIHAPLSIEWREGDVW